MIWRLREKGMLAPLILNFAYVLAILPEHNPAAAVAWDVSAIVVARMALAFAMAGAALMDAVLKVG